MDNYFRIKDIVKELAKFPEIDKVFFWEKDSGEDIVGFMERTLNLSKVFILFCSENAKNSKAVDDEWKAAFQLRKRGLMEIIPVYENEDYIHSLLTPMLIVKYTKDDFEGFIKKLYEEIKR